MAQSHHPESEELAAGWQAILDNNLDAAEQLFQAQLRADESHVDAWNGLGAVHFEHGELKASLTCYRRALAEAKKANGGDLPKNLSWDDKGRPSLRALHGIGLNLFRMGELDEAAATFEDLLARNPEDNQGAHFMLADIKKKKDLWK